MLTTEMIGKRITEARKKKDLSQAQLAEHLFISSQAVGKWERGESLPDIITLTRLAEILSVDLNYFSTGTVAVTTETTSVERSENQPVEKSSEKTNKPARDMSRGNWVGADFSGLKNLHEKFSSSNMKNTKFIGSDMSGLLLKNNNVDSCDFSGSGMSGSRIDNSNMVGNFFKDCVLKEAQFSGSHIKGCDFSGADFTGAVFKGCAFQKNKMVGAALHRTTFSGAHLSDIVFDGKLEDCSFENCGFTKVTFRNSTLTDTFFKGRNLKGIRFVDCQADRMTYEFLKNGKADLSGITLI